METDTKPPKPKQKYHLGDLVHINPVLQIGKSHFTKDIDGIVIGSYADRFGYGGTGSYQSYTVHLKGRGQVSWYDDDDMTLVERNRADILQVWEAEEEAERAQKADIDWIFANGEEVIKRTHGASAATLAAAFGLTDLWGKHGEGITFYSNVAGTMNFAGPFLLAGDKEGYLAACKAHLDSVKDHKPENTCKCSRCEASQSQRP